MLLDENEVAGASPYLSVGDLAVSPNHLLMAYSVDLEGDEFFELRIKDLATGDHLPDTIPDTSYGVVWADDNATLYYLVNDETHRPYRVMRHRLGTPIDDDELVFQEDDPQFWTSIGGTRSERFIVIAAESSTSSEVHLIEANDPHGSPRVVVERRPNHEYRVEHHGDRLLIVTNDDAPRLSLGRSTCV